MSAAKENPCRKFQANIFNKSKCQNCFKPRELHLLTDQDLNQVNHLSLRCMLLKEKHSLGFHPCILLNGNIVTLSHVLYDPRTRSIRLTSCQNVLVESTFFLVSFIRPSSIQLHVDMSCVVFQIFT